jgi:S-phase kinase-associated protein 1
MDKPQITLITKEGTELNIDKKVAMEIPLVRGIIEDSEDETEPIPLGMLSETVLKKIIEFVSYFIEHPFSKLPKPLPKGGLAAALKDEWYLSFMTLEKEDILDMVRASNYLNLERLFELSCSKVGDIIKAMSIEEIRGFFGIENDFTPEEEE